MENKYKRDYHIINCKTVDEFSISFKWAGELGWNPTQDLLTQMHPIDNSGFFTGLKYNPENQSFEIISTISSLKYDNDHGYLGLYIVREDFRGKGFGLPIFKAGLEHLKDCKTIGLDSCPSCDTMYERSGFKAMCFSIRLLLEVTDDVRTRLETISNKDITLAPIEKESIPEILAYDKETLGVDRSRLLPVWAVVSEKTKSTYARDRDGNVTGFGVLKRAVSGYKLGPILSNDVQTAALIFKELISSLSNSEKVTLDVIDLNQEAIQFFMKQFPVQELFRFIWMFTNGFPQGMKTNKIFVRTNDDLGF